MLYPSEQEEIEALKKGYEPAPVFTPLVKKSPVILPASDNVQTLAKAATVHAIQALVDIISDDHAPAASRIAAANALLDRAHGKAVDLSPANNVTVNIVDFRQDTKGNIITIDN